MANLAKAALEAGHLGGPSSRGMYDVTLRKGLTAAEKVVAAADVLEGIAAFRDSLPWWKRWTYCIGSALADLRALKEELL